MLRELGVTSLDTDLLTFVVGLPWGNPGSTNMIRVTSAAGTGRPYIDLKNSKITSHQYIFSIFVFMSLYIHPVVLRVRILIEFILWPSDYWFDKANPGEIKKFSRDF